MTADVEIKYGSGAQGDDSIYTIIMKAESAETFKAAAKDEKVARERGEKLVSAIINFCKLNSGKHGYIVEVNRYMDGKLHNGPDGQDAMACYDKKDGHLTQARSFIANSAVNKPNGDPAYRDFDATGKIVSASKASGDNLVKLTKEQLDVLNAAEEVERGFKASGLRVIRP